MSSLIWQSAAQGETQRLKRGRPLKPKLYLVNCPSVWNKLEESQSLSFSSLLHTETTEDTPKGLFAVSSFTSAPLHLFRAGVEGWEWCVCILVCVCVYMKKREREGNRERDQRAASGRIPAILRVD